MYPSKSKKPSTRFLGNRPVRTKPTIVPKIPSNKDEEKKTQDFDPDDSFAALFADTFEDVKKSQEDPDLLNSTPVVASKSNSMTKKTTTGKNPSKSCGGSILSNASSSMLSSQERLELSSWGLPDTILRQYQRAGINRYGSIVIYNSSPQAPPSFQR
jgi:hypothetical protein